MTMQGSWSVDGVGGCDVNYFDDFPSLIPPPPAKCAKTTTIGVSPSPRMSESAPPREASILAPLLEESSKLFSDVSTKNGPRAAALTAVKLFRTFPPATLMKLLPFAETFYRGAEVQWNRLHATLHRGHATWSHAQLAPLLSVLRATATASMSVMSIGCGEALVDDASVFEAAGIRAELTGIDLMPIKYDLKPGITFRLATGACTGALPNSMDVVFVSNALYNHEELQPTAQELISIVAPGGVIYVVQTFEQHLIDAMISHLIDGGCGLVSCNSDADRRWAILRKGAPSLVPIPPLLPLSPRRESKSDYTITYSVHLPSGEVYEGSHGPDKMMWEDSHPLTFWIEHRWVPSHLELLLAGEHHSPKFQAEFDKTDSSWLLRTPSALKLPAPVVSADGLTHTYSHPCVTIVATRRAEGESSAQAVCAMCMREQVAILRAALDGRLLNASLVVGTVDLDGCVKGGRCGGVNDYRVLQAGRELEAAMTTAAAAASAAAAAAANGEPQAEALTVEAAKAEEAVAVAEDALDHAFAQQMVTSQGRAKGGEKAGGCGGVNDYRVLEARQGLEAAMTTAAAAASEAAAAAANGEPQAEALAVEAAKAEEAVAVAEARLDHAFAQQMVTSQGRAKGGEKAGGCGGVNDYRVLEARQGLEAAMTTAAAAASEAAAAAANGEPQAEALAVEAAKAEEAVAVAEARLDHAFAQQVATAKDREKGGRAGHQQIVDANDLVAGAAHTPTLGGPGGPPMLSSMLGGATARAPTTGSLGGTSALGGLGGGAALGGPGGVPMLSAMLGGLGGGAVLGGPGEVPMPMLSAMLGGGAALGGPGEVPMPMLSKRSSCSSTAGERLWTSTRSASGYKGVQKLPSLKDGTLRFQLDLGPADRRLAQRGRTVALAMGLSSASAVFSTAKAAARVYAAIVGPPP